MQTKRRLTMATLFALLTISTAFGIFRLAQPVQATAGMSTPSSASGDIIAYDPVLPSSTDGSESDSDCVDRPDLAIGCWGRWPESSNNNYHYLFLPSASLQSGKLMVILCGSEGDAEVCGNTLGPVAARQGYHVIALTYPAAGANGPCGDNSLTPSQQRECYGNAFREVVTGEDSSPAIGSEVTDVSEHSQDSIVNRIAKVLKWADTEYPNHGWDRYLAGNNVDWSQVHLAGFSNGSSHISLMGTLPDYQSVGRVTLFAGPNDGTGGSEENWKSADYIQHIAGITDRRYYGLVHYLNHAKSYSDVVLFKVTKNWDEFQMGKAVNADSFYFDPTPGFAPYFGDAHVLISLDKKTTYWESHSSVIRGVYCDQAESDESGCAHYSSEDIGYEPAWRCVLGTGDRWASAPPIANAGANQTVECQGNGGANVVLDGSETKDYDCEELQYAWTGPFGHATQKKPTAFFPLGTSLTSLVVQDDWWFSLPAATFITVADTQPPWLQLTLTPTELWPANHRMVRINATVNATDSCGGPAPAIVLESITSNQPENGSGDGDTAGDIREAAFGTFDVSFLLRAERAGGDLGGRTYTITYIATDASGNATRATATVHVPHSR